MIYLLDTHVLLWSIMDVGKLSYKIREIIEDRHTNIVVSAVSLWEISLKFSLNKLPLQGVTPEELPPLIEEIGFELIAIKPEEASTYHHLKSNKMLS